MTHVHKWEYVMRGAGIPPKQNVLDPVIFDGHVCKCECGVRMFFPDNYKLKPVEIEGSERWRPNERIR